MNVLAHTSAVADSPSVDFLCSTCYRMKCKVRCFYSKGAFLVLFWFCLIIGNTWSLIRLYNTLFQGLNDVEPYYSSIALVPTIPFFVLAPLYGWLADVYFGNYKVFKSGMILSCLAAVLSCICVLILMNVNENNTVLHFISGGVSPVVYILGFNGVIACFVTALQLGLDQMPDASSSNIASFVNWFVFSIFIGFWVFDTISVPWDCTSTTNNDLSVQLFSLLPAVGSCICCCTFFLLAPKWLIIEPKCPQSLKTVYQVVKFAAKHKAPLNRSAFTYWEEDIPSRFDLGKSKYGGPFTTEQVENVKTFFRIIFLILPVTLIVVSMSPRDSLMLFSTATLPGLSACSSELVYTFTYSPWWCSIVTMLVNELVVRPLLQHRYPSILKSIGIAAFLGLVSNIGFLALSVFDSLYSSDLPFWLPSLYGIIVGIFLQFTLAKVLELVCAQSPYNMRGLLAGYVSLVFLLAVGIGVSGLRLFMLCHGHYCLVIKNSILAALSLISFIIYCVLAHWYKMRVRDEEYNAHRVVKEVYDRYLSREH